MALCKLPMLSHQDLNQFELSKKFYHFWHDQHLRSFHILDAALKQHQLILDQHRLAEETIRTMVQKEGQFCMLRLDIKKKIAELRINQAESLMALERVLQIMMRQARLLKPIVGEREHCQSLSADLDHLLSFQDRATLLLAGEACRLMELGSVDLLFLNQNQFASLHQVIETHAHPKLLSHYRRLNWFAGKRVEKVVPIEINHQSLFVYEPLKDKFPNKHWFFNLFFNEEHQYQLLEDQFYRRAKLLSNEQHLSTSLLLLNQDGFCFESISQLPFLGALNQCEQDILSYHRLLQSQSQSLSRFEQFFYPGKNEALLLELNELPKHFAKVQDMRLSSLEKLFTELEEKYHHAHFDFVPKATLDEVIGLFQDTETKLKQLPGFSSQTLTTRLSNLKSRLATKFDVIQPIIRAIYHNKGPFKTQSLVAENGLGYVTCDREAAASLLDKIKPYVSQSQQEALGLLEALVTQKPVPHLALLKQTLQPLFIEFNYPATFLEDFVDKLLQTYVKPSLHDPGSSQFRLVAEVDSPYIQCWLDKRVPLLDEAFLFLKQALNHLPLNGQTISINQKAFPCTLSTLLTQVKLMKTFGSVEQGRQHLEKAKALIRELIPPNQASLPRHREWLDILLLLEDESLMSFYLPALIESGAAQSEFTLFKEAGLVDYLNHHPTGLQVFETKCLAYFESHHWDPVLQAGLDKLADKKLAENYRYLFIRSLMLDEAFSTQYASLFTVNQDAILDLIGSHHLVSSYDFLREVLSSPKVIPASSLKVIDFLLLKAPFARDVIPLRLLFERKREALIEQNDIIVETKAILALIQESRWQDAWSRLQGHIALGEVEADRHVTLASQVLKGLFEYHSCQVTQGKPPAFNSQDQEAQWRFYQGLRLVLHERKACLKLLAEFKKIEHQFLTHTSPMAYFFAQFLSLKKEQLSLDTLSSLLSSTLHDMEAVISQSEKEALLKVIQLIRGEWVPQNKDELCSAFSVLDDNSQFTQDEIIECILQTFILPTVKDPSSPYFSLLYSLKPAWLEKIIEQAERKIAGEFYFLNKVFLEPALLTNGASVWVNHEERQPSIKHCLVALEKIHDFEKWQNTYVISSQNKELPSYRARIGALIQDYLLQFAKEPDDIRLLPLIEQHGDELLLDHYLILWLNNKLSHLNSDQLTKDPTLTRFLRRSSLQETLKSHLLANIVIDKAENVTACAGFPFSTQETPQSTSFFDLLPLLTRENRQAVLSQWVSRQRIWTSGHHEVIEQRANNEAKQQYRYLHLKTCFSHPDDRGYVEHLPLGTDCQFETLYGKDRCQAIVDLLASYLDAPFHVLKVGGYSAILNALTTTQAEPWLGLKEKASRRLQLMQEHEAATQETHCLIEKIKEHHLAPAISLIEQWHLMQKESTRESGHAKRCLKATLEALGTYLAALIQQKARTDIAMLRDFILCRFPKEQVNHLTLECNQQTTLQFDGQNLQLQANYHRLFHFEHYAWAYLKHTVPELDEQSIAAFKCAIASMREENLGSVELRFIKWVRFYDVTSKTSKALIDIYLKHEDSMKPVFQGLLKVYYRFDACRLAKTQGRLNPSLPLEHELMRRAQFWWEESTSLWATFFGRPKDKGTLEAEQRLAQSFRGLVR